MTSRVFSFAILLFVLVACSQPAAEVAKTSNEEATSFESEGKVFGEAADFSAPLAYTDMLGKLVAAPADTMDVTVTGTVNEVCQAKGCWMTINGDENMMVKFKDYGFFVPKDISGREVVMHGKAYYQTTPVDELQHYAEDAGKSAEEIAAITEPKRELRFLASGVMLMN